MKPTKPELILPAGSILNLKTAFAYGADAVYCGYPGLSLRVCDDWKFEDVKRAVDTARLLDKKIYLALNLVARNDDIDRLSSVAADISELNPSGIIVSDPGVFVFMKKLLPNMPITVSTQANVRNYATLRFWEDLGAESVVLSRECGFDEIATIKHKAGNMKIEVFIHGSMCMSVSGRCLISNYLLGRDANRGQCAQPCRWEYLLTEKDSDRKYLIEEDGRGSYILSSKDLCLMPVLHKYTELGIDRFKVEGRRKNEHYIATVAKAYKNAIAGNYPSGLQYLLGLGNRGYTLGFHNGNVSRLSYDYESTVSVGDYQFAGTVTEVGEDWFILEVRNTLEKGREIELITYGDTEPIRIDLHQLIDAKTGKEIEKASAGQGFSIKILRNCFGQIADGDAANVFSVGMVARILANNGLEQQKIIEKRKQQFMEEVYAAERQ